MSRTISQSSDKKKTRHTARKKKINPDATIEEVVKSITSGTLDKRTKAALRMKSVKQALGTDARAVALALLRHDVSVYAAVNQEIVEHVLGRDGNALDDDGALPEIMQKEYPNFQRNLVSSLQALMKLEKQIAKDSGGQEEPGKTLRDLVVDCESKTPNSGS